MTHGTGEAIGPYDVVRPLGGSDGAPMTWLARRRSDHSELVVVRRLGPTLGPSRHQEGAVPTLPDTGRRHPNVVQLLDSLHLGSDVTVVTEFAAGGSLRRRLAAGPLDVGETITVMAGVASALADWHSHDEVHGALHPGRVLFQADGRPVVDAVGVRGVGPGMPPSYASPEVARGHRPEPSDDVFALGSVAVQCLSGKPAWPADELRDVVIQSVFGQWPAAPDGIPRELAELLTKMLDREPAARPAAAEVFLRLADCGVPAPVRLLTATSESPALSADPVEPVRAADFAEPAQRASSSSAEIEREWLTDSPNVAEWLRAAVRRPVAPPVEAGREEPAEAGRGGAPFLPARLYDRAAVRMMAAAVAAVAVLAGIWLTAMPGAESAAGSGDAPASGISSSSAQSSGVAPLRTDWMEVLSRLDELRARAFHTADVSLLNEVYAPESAALDADAARIGELAAAGYLVPPIVHDIRSVIETGVDGAGPATATTQGDPPVTLAVEQAMPAFEIHDSAGGLVGHTIEQLPARSTVTLVHHAGTYRILSVADVA